MLRNWKKGMFPLLSYFSKKMRNMKRSWWAKPKLELWELHWFGFYSAKNEKTLEGFKQASAVILSASIKDVWKWTRKKQEWKWRNQWRGRREQAKRNWRKVERYVTYFGGKMYKFCWQTKTGFWWGREQRLKAEGRFPAWGKRNLALQLNEMKMTKGGIHLMREVRNSILNRYYLRCLVRHPTEMSGKGTG